MEELGWPQLNLYTWPYVAQLRSMIYILQNGQATYTPPMSLVDRSMSCRQGFFLSYGP